MTTEPSRPYVLHVVADPLRRAGQRAALAEAGFDVLSVADGEEAFSALLDLHACGCIVLDAAITGLSAPLFLERARSYLRFHGIPVVLLGDVTERAVVARVRLPTSATPAEIVAAVVGVVRAWSVIPRSAAQACE